MTGGLVGVELGAPKAGVHSCIQRSTCGPIVNQLRQDFGVVAAYKCDTHKALVFSTLRLGTRRSVVPFGVAQGRQIHSPRPLFSLIYPDHLVFLYTELWMILQTRTPRTPRITLMRDFAINKIKNRILKNQRMRLPTAASHGFYSMYCLGVIIRLTPSH